MKRRSVVLLAGVGLSAAIGSFYWLKDKDSLVRQNGYKGSALPDAWDSSADVIVVGGGAAGLSAALSASESGASVILIEQNDIICQNNFRHSFSLTWSGKTCDIRRSL